MIESLINLDEMKKRPVLTFLWAFLVNSIAIIAASQMQSIQEAGIGLFSVLFTIIPSVYFMVLLIRREEQRDEESAGKAAFWETHGKDIAILLLYFFGVTLSFALWGYALPDGSFGPQMGKINQIRGIGAVSQDGVFVSILMNNLQVMTIAFIFSLIFGAGAIFILVWNASVLGVFIGQFSKSLWHIPLVSAGFLPHGIPEIGGYVAAALAGGIFSAAILRRKKDAIPYVVLDSLKLLLLGVLLIAVGALIEVYM